MGRSYRSHLAKSVKALAEADLIRKLRTALEAGDKAMTEYASKLLPTDRLVEVLGEEVPETDATYRRVKE